MCDVFKVPHFTAVASAVFVVWQLATRIRRVRRQMLIRFG